MTKFIPPRSARSRISSAASSRIVPHVARLLERLRRRRLEGGPSAHAGSPIASADDSISDTGGPILCTGGSIARRDDPTVRTGDPIASTDDPIVHTGDSITHTDDPIVHTGDSVGSTRTHQPVTMKR